MRAERQLGELRMDKQGAGPVAMRSSEQQRRELFDACFSCAKLSCHQKLKSNLELALIVKVESN